jgi:hypothetical protein
MKLIYPGSSRQKAAAFKQLTEVCASNTEHNPVAEYRERRRINQSISHQRSFTHITVAYKVALAFDCIKRKRTRENGLSPEPRGRF